VGADRGSREFAVHFGQGASQCTRWASRSHSVLSPFSWTERTWWAIIGAKAAIWEPGDQTTGWL